MKKIILLIFAIAMMATSIHAQLVINVNDAEDPEMNYRIYSNKIFFTRDNDQWFIGMDDILKFVPINRIDKIENRLPGGPNLVTDVSISHETLKLSVGESKLLFSAARPSNLAGKNIYWYIRDESIAYISRSPNLRGGYIITGKNPGKTTLMVIIDNKRALCTVEVTENTIEPTCATDVKINPPSMDLLRNNNGTLTATVTPSNLDLGELRWYSSDPTIAYIPSSSDGVCIVTGKNPGRTKIMAIIDNVYAECDVEVFEKTQVTSVTINPSRLRLLVGGSENLTVTVTPSDLDLSKKNLSVGCRDTSIADVSINSDGEYIVIGKNLGRTKIIAYIEGVQAECDVEVVSAQEVTSVTIDPSSLQLSVGGSGNLTATVMPNNLDLSNKSFQWYVRDTFIVNVSTNADGVCIVTGKNPGRTTVMVEVDGVSASCDVEVTGNTPGTDEPTYATGVTINPTSLQLSVDGSGTLTAIVSPSNLANKNFYWYSSDTDVADVSTTPNSDGVCIVTGKSPGRVKISVVIDNVHAECIVEVIDDTEDDADDNNQGNNQGNNNTNYPNNPGYIPGNTPGNGTPGR